MPKYNRVKIGTLKLSYEIKNKRLGEGIIATALWWWQVKCHDEIYVTIFEKHKSLIDLLTKFGFVNKGLNKNNEYVLVKNKFHMNYDNPYEYFPFISPNIEYAGIIPIEAIFHDQLFPYSELQNNKLKVPEIIAGNGVSKIFIACPYSSLNYKTNTPVFIYRKAEKGKIPKYHAVITSFCTVNTVNTVKHQNKYVKNFSEFKDIVGNKSVYSDNELHNIYYNKTNIIVLELLYNGFLGKGKNVNFDTLESNDLFKTYPYQIRYTKDEFLKILNLGDKNENDIIVHQPTTC